MDLVNVMEIALCRDRVLSFLPVNDLLRLRRVCKSSKNQAEDFIKIRRIQTGRELKIDFTDPDPFKEYDKFQNNVSSCLPTRTHVHLLVLEDDDEESSLFTFRKPLRNLMKSCGNVITHLTTPLSARVILDFLNSCPNVTNLTLNLLADLNPETVIEEESENESISSSEYIPPNFQFPSTLKNLKRLTFTLTGTGNIWMEDQDTFLVQFLESCIPNLERLSLPFGDLELYDPDDWVLIVRLTCLALFKAPNLKLERVPGGLIEQLLNSDDHLTEMGSVEMMTNRLRAKVISIRMPKEMSFTLGFPNLEEISLGNLSDGDCVIPPDPLLVSREWPKLMSIAIQLKDAGEEDAKGIWDVLFVGIVRQNLVKLYIKSYHGRIEYPCESIQRTMDLVASCPNLRTLEIQSAIKKLVHLPVLWRGLAHLDNLTLSDGDDLEDEDFIGDDPESPAFSNLKDLKAFKLGCSPRWPNKKLTDVLLSRVLCYMELKEFELSGWFQKISIDGIMGLLYGKFGGTVERISINRTVLKGVETVRRLRHVESLFSSSEEFKRDV